MNSIVAAGILLVGVFAAGAQSTPVIESFHRPGTITFVKVTNATQYRVEWSATAGASWTNFGVPQLDVIVSPGLGLGTASVPNLFRVVATLPPPGMVLIPAGSFVMGNATNVFSADEGGSIELPQHTVNVSGFYMDVYEVTKALWDDVRAYNDGNGYTYSYTGAALSISHPVGGVNWFDAAKWCNARSQRDGLMPVYYTDEALTTIYKTGEQPPHANWAANGYRLPTEAEWEKAARGGHAYHRFPWHDVETIQHARANYYSVAQFVYDTSPTRFDHPDFILVSSPVGYFAPNGYGLYDMAGNVWEWCWDWFDGSYYSNSPLSDPKGPTEPPPNQARVMRGGTWQQHASHARVANRSAQPHNSDYYTYGFRCARGL